MQKHDEPLYRSMPDVLPIAMHCESFAAEGAGVSCCRLLHVLDVVDAVRFPYIFVCSRLL